MVEFERRCLSCNKEFITSIANQKYCCIECRNQAYGITEPTYEIRMCKVCGRGFNWSRKVRNKIYCSKECASIAQQQKNKETSPHNGELWPRTENRICVGCGRPFLWSSSRKNQIYCSTKCRIETEAGKNQTIIQSEERSCALCGNVFTWFSNKYGQKYCSEECRKRAQKEKIKESEKRKKERKSSIIDEHVKNVVTDLIFRAQKAKEARRGVSFDYWLVEEIGDDIRENVLERDHYRCQICGSTGDVLLHFIVKPKNGGGGSAENLVTLCKGCHRHVETGDLEYAINKCIRNAYRNHQIVYESRKESHGELIDTSIYILQNLFSEFSTFYPDESEYLRRLDTVIDNLEKVKED